MPKFSIITVCYNAEKTIERTLKSVEEQTCSDFELIVIDGASTDTTNSIIKKYSNKITKYISEPDKGIYDAMNKGISHATGEYIFFLNADDFFASPSSLADVKNSIKGSPDIVSCNIILFDESGEKAEKLKPLNIFTILEGHFVHPAFFAKRILFKSNGLFDTSYKIAADLDWAVRVFLGKCSYQKIECFCTKFFLGGISSVAPEEQLQTENQKVRKNNNLATTTVSFLIRVEKIFRGLIEFFHLENIYANFASQIILRTAQKNRGKTVEPNLPL